MVSTTPIEVAMTKADDHDRPSEQGGRVAPDPNDHDARAGVVMGVRERGWVPDSEPRVVRGQRLARPPMFIEANWLVGAGEG
ncbi:MAG: hypothetical protein HIU57_00950 [Acidobacteria bacterium]|nr:hypothetical protein [Acidobacteriota bacterium]